ncbi:MAG: hypothetical protein R3E01_06795 [Pirellulaceae bacterium]|nr:hypothetical protein [Planctomycetales bacterium]
MLQDFFSKQGFFQTLKMGINRQAIPPRRDIFPPVRSVPVWNLKSRFTPKRLLANDIERLPPPLPSVPPDSPDPLALPSSQLPASWQYVTKHLVARHHARGCEL